VSISQIPNVLTSTVSYHAHPSQVFFAEAEALQPGITGTEGECQLHVPARVATLRAALGSLAQRHPILRTSLPRSPEIVDSAETSYWWTARRQVVQSDVRVEIEELDETGTGAPAPILPTEALPAFATRLLSASDGRQVLRIHTHHGVMDGWSWMVLWQDLDRAIAGKLPQFPSSSRSFAEYTEHQYSQWSLGKWKRNISAWTRRLSRYKVVQFPSSSTSLSVWPISRSSVFPISGDWRDRFATLTETTQRSEFAVAAALFCGALYDVFGWVETPVCLVSANRGDHTLRNTLGVVANLVPSCFSLRGQVPDLVERSWRSMVQAQIEAIVPLPILLSDCPDLRTVLEAQPRISIRQPDAWFTWAARSRQLTTLSPQVRPRADSRAERSLVVEQGAYDNVDPEEMDLPSARAYGIGQDLIFDAFLERPVPTFRLTYRSDKVSGTSVNEIIDAFSERLRTA
jgi:hypothetical protein